MSRRILFIALLCLTALPQVRAMTPDERRDYLAKLQTILPKVPSFQQWLDKTNELPPDFDALPRVNGLPDPLKFLDGRPVRTPLIAARSENFGDVARSRCWGWSSCCSARGF